MPSRVHSILPSDSAVGTTADSDNSCHTNRGMLAALTASKFKHHKDVFAKRQDNALTAGEFRAATGSASRCDQFRVCHSQFHCYRPQRLRFAIVGSEKAVVLTAASAEQISDNREVDVRTADQIPCRRRMTWRASPF